MRLISTSLANRPTKISVFVSQLSLLSSLSVDHMFHTNVGTTVHLEGDNVASRIQETGPSLKRNYGMRKDLTCYIELCHVFDGRLETIVNVIVVDSTKD